MLPSSTVENYLKAIYRYQVTLAPDQLVPMGQIASALSVAPGTATTMVKALAESGLVTYEPYGGARLAPGGEKLAALVLRDRADDRAGAGEHAALPVGEGGNGQRRDLRADVGRGAARLEVLEIVHERHRERVLGQGYCAAAGVRAAPDPRWAPVPPA